MCKNHHNLLTISSKELKNAYKKQQKMNEWNFFDERKHMEKLLCTRFNYLILVFSLFVTAFATVKDKTEKIVILSTGLLILILVSLTVRRAYLKLDINLKILHKLQKNNCNESKSGYNAMSIIDKEVQTRCVPLNGTNKLIGFWIPLILILLFMFGLLFVGAGWWSF